jgi:hypothetical protein
MTTSLVGAIQENESIQGTALLKTIQSDDLQNEHAS